MTTPAYSHTYTYSRVGAGDVIVLDPAGAPYSFSTVLPSGWTVQLAYTTDPLASVHDASKWEGFNDGSPSGTIPSVAVKLAVNVLSVSSQTPVSDRLKVTISSDNYKAATGLRNTDSGAHSSVLPVTGKVFPPAVESLMIWLPCGDETQMFTDADGLLPADEGDQVLRINNLGFTETAFVDDLGIPSSPLLRDEANQHSPGGSNFLESTNDAMTDTGWDAARSLPNGYTVAFAFNVFENGTINLFGYGGNQLIAQVDSNKNFQIKTLPAESQFDTTWNIADNTWYWYYLSVVPDRTFQYRLAGQSEASGVASQFLPVNAETLFVWMNATASSIMRGLDFMMWDRPLTVAERNAIPDYFDNQYDTFPLAT